MESLAKCFYLCFPPKRAVFCRSLARGMGGAQQQAYVFTLRSCHKQPSFIYWVHRSCSRADFGVDFDGDRAQSQVCFVVSQVQFLVSSARLNHLRGWTSPTTSFAVSTGWNTLISFRHTVCFSEMAKARYHHFRSESQSKGKAVPNNNVQRLPAQPLAGSQRLIPLSKKESLIHARCGVVTPSRQYGWKKYDLLVVAEVIELAC